MQVSRIMVNGCLMYDRLDTTILVPLTNSLYVPGKLSDTEHVIVDIGTGYYVKKVITYQLASYSCR